MKRLILPVAIMGLCTVAMAHPHNSDTDIKADEPKVERIWPNFGKKAERKSDTAKSFKKGLRVESGDTMDAEDFTDRLERRFERHAKKMERNLERAKAKNKFLKDNHEIESLEDIGDAARALEDMLSESGILSSLADMMVDLADDFEIDSSDDGVSLNFEGKRLGRLKMDKDSRESFGLEGFGKNMSVNREVIRKNGKTKTRIVIEMDGDEEFDIEVKPKD